jgi:hypothetical protein
MIDTISKFKLKIEPVRVLYFGDEERSDIYALSSSLME